MTTVRKHKSNFKFRLEHHGKIVAETDYSNILFDYLKREKVKSENFAIFNNITGLPAGTATAKPKATTTRKTSTTTRRAARTAK